MKFKIIGFSLILSTLLSAETFINPLPASVKATDNGGSKSAIDAYKDGIGAELMDKPGIATDNSAMNILVLKYGAAAKANNVSVVDQVIYGNSNPTAADLALAGRLTIDGASCNDNNINTTGEIWLNGSCQGGVSTSLVNFSDNNKLGLTTDQLATLATYLGITTPTTLTSIYDSSIHAKTATEFHNRSNNNSHIVVLVKTTTGEIIGGYTGSLYYANRSSYVSGTNSKIFNLTKNIVSANSLIYPVNALYDTPSYGPTFGGGHDLYVYGSMLGGYCSNHTYNLGTVNLFGGSSNSGSVAFSISNMIVYDIIGR